jgi:hypothetical protein
MSGAGDLHRQYGEALRPGALALRRHDHMQARVTGLRLTHRHVVILASGLFLLPNALIAASFAPIAAATVFLGCAGALYVLVTSTAARAGWLASRVEPMTLALCALAAVALCVLGGEGHFFYANFDWLTRDALLADLVRRPFPLLYGYQGGEFMLRAPLGMYMTPALIGKLFGLHAAHVALLAQNVAILTLTLTALASLVPARKSVFLFVFVAFSGIEIVVRLADVAAAYASSGALSWPVHAHQHLAWWNPFFQYTSNLTQIFWVPNHAFPGWWLAALGLLHARREIDSAILIVAFAFVFFWSPLAAAGAIPIVGYLVLRRDYAHLFDARIIVACVAALCFLPLVVYLGADAESVPHSWLFLVDGFWPVYVIFVAIQIPQAAVVWVCRQKLAPEWRELAALAIVLLLLIPFYRLGVNNDFAMRVSIAPLTLLAFAFAAIAAQLKLRDGVGRVAAVVTIVGLSAVTPALEVQRALMLDRFAVSDCNLLTTWRYLEPSTWISNYLARADRMPVWLLRRDNAAPPATVEARQCWPDHPFTATPMSDWREPARW